MDCEGIEKGVDRCLDFLKNSHLVLEIGKIYNISALSPPFPIPVHPMQAQYSSVSSAPLDHYHPTYSTLNDQFFATTGTDNFPGSFLRGSSLMYPHEDYQYLNDRGGPSSTELSSTTFTAATITEGPFGVTDSAYPEDTVGLQSPGGRGYCHTEGISTNYGQSQGWQWPSHNPLASPLHPQPLAHSHPHAPTLLQLPNRSSGTIQPDPAFLNATPPIKSAITVGIESQPYPVRSPTAQLPTPAAMAALLNSNSRLPGERGSQQITMDNTLPTQQKSTPRLQLPINVADGTVGMAVPDMISREKKHACNLCPKRFDRPSTLRKHLLVHTRERAFACDTCGRRFGVASNLNRHVRRCILKPVNAVASSTTSSSTSPAATRNSPTIMTSDQDSTTVKPKRGRALSSTESISSSSSSSNTSHSPNRSGNQKQEKPPGQKRRRRAPSPSVWIPWSLRNFNLICDEYYRATVVPLPPVKRNLPKEERDSWDENVSATPYHPLEWKGVLPGPGLGHGFGLGGKDVRNINFGGSGGIMLGRVLVF